MKERIKLNFNFDSYSLFIIFLFYTFSFFLPSILNYNYNYFQNDQNNQFLFEMKSQLFLGIQLLAMGVSLPMLFDILLDIKDIPLKLLIPRILISFGLLFTTLIYYFLSQNNPTLYVGTYRARLSCIFCSLTLSLYECETNKRNKLISLSIIFVAIAYGCCNTWNGILFNSVIPIIVNILIGTLVTLGVIRVFIYISDVRKSFGEVMSTTSKKIAFIYGFLCSCYMIGVYTIWFSFGARPWNNISVSEVTLYTILDVVIGIIAVNLPSKISRGEAAVYRVFISLSFYLLYFLLYFFFIFYFILLIFIFSMN